MKFIIKTFLIILFATLYPLALTHRLFAASNAEFNSCQEYLTTSGIDSNDLQELQHTWRRLVGQRLNLAIVQKNQSSSNKYTKTQLSRDTKIDNSSIVKYVKGEFSIPLKNAQRISETLEIDLNWLLAEDLLEDFNVNGFKVLPEHFKGLNMHPLSDAFTFLIWSKDTVTKQNVIDEESNSSAFCIQDCSTEELVQELSRRGWNINLNLKD